MDTHTFRECTMNAEREKSEIGLDSMPHSSKALRFSGGSASSRHFIPNTGDRLIFFFFRKKKIYNNLILILVCPLFFMARCNQARKRQHTKIPSLTCLVTFYKLKKVLYAKHVQLGGIKKNMKTYHKTGIMNRFKVTDLHSRGWQLLLSKK